METYAIANQKGGVGKTTVTLGLAAELARREVRTLLVDLDPQASATKVLGVDVDERPTVADALLEPDRFALADAIVGDGLGLRPCAGRDGARVARVASGDGRRVRPAPPARARRRPTTPCSWTVRRASGC